MRVLLFAHAFTICMFFLFPVSDSQAQSGTAPSASRNDHIFPSAPAARPFIDFDKKGFLINGKRTFVVSASMEYARVPRGLWYDRLLKLKRGGFNTVEIYTFWNYHEPREGEFDFSGDQDLDAFLKLVKKLDMYAIVRVGPYYCAEWALGGYPIWLKFKPGLRVREDNPPFLSAVSNFFDKLIPIVSANQINRGGPVIMVQLENEHRAGWGTIVPNGYFRFLIDKTVSLGLQVPYFFSGLHPGNDPAGNLKSLDDPNRPNPWFSTEYWGVWFSNYGPQPQDSTIYDRRTWKILARGGNGYNVYMAHGGSNFDYNNDRDMAASYDYGAAVGQAGDLRPIYYGFKRAAWFARSFQEVLANSTDATGNKDISSAADTSLVTTARYGPAGTITFFDNPGDKPVITSVKAPEKLNLNVAETVDIAPGEIFPVVQNFSLTTHITIHWAPARIYSITPQGNTTTVVVYGTGGKDVKLYFKVPEDIRLIPGNGNFGTLSSGILAFSAPVSLIAPAEYSFSADNHQVRILVVNKQLAQRTWFVDNKGETSIVVGPAFAGEAKAAGKRLQVVTERSWHDSTQFPVWVYKPESGPVRMVEESKPGDRPEELELRPWQFKNASEPKLPGYDDRSWAGGEQPPQMGADGDLSSYAWYRTKLQVPESGKYILQFKNVRERASFYLDGKWISDIALLQKSTELDLQAGKKHYLAVFASHTGRNKQIFYVGPLDSVDAKGLSGPVTLQKKDGTGAVIRVTQWKMTGGPGDPKGWKKLSSDTELHSPHFFKTKFSVPSLKGTQPVWRVITTSLSYGSVWINGHNLGRYPEKIKINGLYIPETWLKKGTNTMVIFDESGVHPGRVSVQSEKAAGRDVTIYVENDR